MATSKTKPDITTGAGGLGEITENLLHKISQELQPVVRRKDRSTDELVDDDDEVNPHDSVSQQGSHRSSRTSSSRSIRAERTRAMQREIELAARAAVMKQRHEIENRKRELQRDLEQKELQLRRHVEQQQAELDYKHEELQLEADREAAKAFSRVLDDEYNEVASTTSNSFTQKPAIETQAKETHVQNSASQKPATGTHATEIHTKNSTPQKSAAEMHKTEIHATEIHAKNLIPQKSAAEMHKTETNVQNSASQKLDAETNTQNSFTQKPAIETQAKETHVQNSASQKPATGTHATEIHTKNSTPQKSAAEMHKTEIHATKIHAKNLTPQKPAAEMHKTEMHTQNSNPQMSPPCIGLYAPQMYAQHMTPMMNSTERAEQQSSPQIYAPANQARQGTVIESKVGLNYSPQISVSQAEYNPQHMYAQPVYAPQTYMTYDGSNLSPSAQVGQVQNPDVPHAKDSDQSSQVTTILEKLVQNQRESALPPRQLKAFNGIAMEFTSFIKSFKFAIERNTEDPARRLEMLIRHTTGEAYELIKNCTMIEPASMGYKVALNLLHRDYGQPAIIATEFKEKANSWPKIMNGDKEGLRKFSIFLINLVNTKQGNNDMITLDGYEFLKVLASKLPTPLQQRWIVQVGKLREQQYRSPGLQDFEYFVGQLSRNENDPRIAGLGYQRRVENDKRQNNSKYKGNNRNVFAASVHEDTKVTEKVSKGRKASETPCMYCKGKAHNILNCRKFSALQTETKSEFCSKSGLCYGCLNPGHRKKQCRKPEKCSKCARRHPTALHNPDWEKKTDSKDETTGENTPKVPTGCVSIEEKMCARTGTSRSSALMTIVPVIVKAKASDIGIATYAFLDNGCGAVFADEELASELNTRTRETKLVLTTLNLEQEIKTQMVTDSLQIGNIDGSSFIDLPEVYLKDKIPVGKENIPTQQDLRVCDHLSSINLPELPQSIPRIPRVTIMVGINVPAATTPLESLVGPLGQPYAIRSPLGWLVYGLVGENDKTNANFCNISSITAIQHSNERLERQLKGYMNMEFQESLADTTLRPSKEDKQFIKMMDDRVTVQDGHYIVPLPFREDDIEMPNNYTQAHMYLQHLKKKLTKDKPLHQEYTAFMDKLETKGYAEQVPLDQINRDDGLTWYIPHHAVQHPRKSARVVFNCPASYKGTSLNGQLLQGPDMTNRLFGILLRWRKEQVAIMADIEAMFYQVHVTPEDRDLLRYLWWPKGDLTGDPKIYHMKVHVFGAVSSPSCANYALRRCAIDNASRYDQKVTDAVLHDFYVDDFVKSMEEESEAVELVKNIKELLAQGGFNLTKWVSNSRQVLDSIPTEDRAKGVKNLDIHCDDLPTERTLGVLWDVESDQIGVAVKEVDQRATRRNILSVLSQVYDPIGHTAPYVLKAKGILQTCTKEKISWDENIPQEQQQQWHCWLQDLPKLESLKIDRCYRPKSFGKIVDTQLHHFADASQDGYGTVTYLRITSDTGNTHCSFVAGKARVAPLKPHTIVKLELTAATTSVKQDNMIKRELDMEINSTTFWTDSQTVLKYIKNQTTRLPIFVSNRVAIIQDGSDETQWRYVPSEMNPADHASRGLTVSELTSKGEWLQGPEFLWKDESKWPTMTINQKTKENLEENPSKKEIPVHVSKVKNPKEPIPKNEVDKPEDTVNRLIHYYSEWTKLKRATAWLLRFKKYLQMKSNPTMSLPLETKTLTLEEIEKAEEAIIIWVQHEAFPQEIRCLQKAKRTEEDKNECSHDDQARGKINSSIANLDPVLIDDVLRVGGRLRNAQIPQNAKHQVILPKDHHVSTLIIRHIHRSVKHQGRNHVLAELRQKFWIIRARAAIKSMISKCFICKKRQARAGNQKMADLPSYRVKPEEPAFVRTGMDYFGPFEVKQGRTTRKRYGVIFTCLNSRAIHIEIAHSLDTSSCIEAIRRFIARRGRVQEIHSDNGTNLVGANKELQKAIKELKQDDLTRFSTNQEIKWFYNPPAASHHGGVWERQIRTIRKLLQAVLEEQHLKVAKSEEQLHTLMCEIESTINCRPLTKSSDDLHDFDVITPNHLLHLKPTESLPPGKFSEKDIYAKKRWRQMQYLADLFWKRWTKEYLPDLQKRQRWLQPKRNIQVGDVVLIVDDQAPRNSWTMGLVQETHVDKQGLVRSAKVKTKSTILTRPITKLCLLLEQDN